MKPGIPQAIITSISFKFAFGGVGEILQYGAVFKGNVTFFLLATTQRR